MNRASRPEQAETRDGLKQVRGALNRPEARVVRSSSPDNQIPNIRATVVLLRTSPWDR